MACGLRCKRLPASEVCEKTLKRVFSQTVPQVRFFHSLSAFPANGLTAMDEHEPAMLAFVKLAGVSQSREQLGPRDKFLVLAGVSAARAGHAAVAARCRALLLSHNPAHLLKRYETIEAALGVNEFQAYLRQLARFCPYEKAEHLLAQLDISTALPDISARLSAADYALLLLGHSPGR
jgi:hypothetical protein